MVSIRDLQTGDFFVFMGEQILTQNPEVKALRPIFLSMVIEPNQIRGKPRKVGKVGSDPVWELESKGGLSMITVDRGGKLETIGSGPLSAVARHIAENREKDIVWTEIRKSDYIAPEHFQHLLPEYEELTDRLRDRQGF